MKIKFSVQEVIYHSRALDVSDDLINELRDAVDDDGLLSEILGDFTNGTTAENSEYMEGSFEVIEDE